MVEVEMVDEVADIQSYATQTGRPWGLQRISNDAGATGNPKGQDFIYTFNDDDLLGAGVDIYVVDTGVRTSHAAFEGRATFGANTGVRDVTDGDGHGTHVAGTAGGAFFGVAQKANIIAIKILKDDGSGSTISAAQGMERVIDMHNAAKSRPGFIGSVMSMSWGLGGVSDSTDLIIQSAIDAGIHVSVAAGNDGADACLSTPSRNGGTTSSVVSVGAMNIDNEVSSFSNIGSCVDIYAPGEQILSAWNISDTTINFISGTSMACPHVSGVMATLMALDPEGLGQDPAALKAKLLSTAREGQIAGTNELLLSNGANGNLKRLMKNWVVTGTDTEEKRTLTGSPATWAKNIVKNFGKRWSVHSFDSALRY
ncbi:subtilisin-like protein [Amniculicola lignicola CBS 123094]|uniref:Subtilisin-like protein n=1 Tax=Amniculicola lignicola CBS 123094 TaxID=1392246 RepID=A0A6A5W598_9PLEO|nr:subtilisin-like protein [Amniculicola lignicola CBS 123094]